MSQMLNAVFRFHPEDIQDFVVRCNAVGIPYEDIQHTIDEIIGAVISGADDDLPTRELKKLLIFMRELSLLFKSCSVSKAA